MHAKCFAWCLQSKPVADGSGHCLTSGHLPTLPAPSCHGVPTSRAAVTLAGPLGLPGSPCICALPETPGAPSLWSRAGLTVLMSALSAVTQMEKPAIQKEATTPHTVKLRGAPFNVTEVRPSNE